MASPRCRDSRGMLAEVSINTVTASFSTRSGAHGPDSAITSAVKDTNFRARHAGDDPGALRIQNHRTGINPVSTRKIGWSIVTQSPAHKIWIAKSGFFPLF